MFEPYWTEKPWGREMLWASTEHYAAKMLYIEPGQRLSLQKHVKKEETIFVWQGPMILTTVGGEEREIEPGGVVHIAPGQVHRFAAPAEGHVLLFEVSTPHLDDVLRLEDAYGRVSDFIGRTARRDFSE